MNFKNFIQLLRDAVDRWRSVQASLMAAALAYYTLFSLAPLLIIVMFLVGFFLGQDVARRQLSFYMHAFAGPDIARFVQDIIKNTNKFESGVVATVFGIGVFIFGSVEIFYKLRIALNTIWGIKTETHPIEKALTHRFISLTFVVGLGFVLLFLFTAGAILSVVSRGYSIFMPGFVDLRFWQVTEAIASLIIVAVLFAAAYKMIPAVKIFWRDVWGGALIASILFALGRFFIGWYLGTRGFSSLYGAAGSLVAFLVWIYYSTQIFLYGAAVTYVYAHQCGSLVGKDQSMIARVKKKLEEIRKH